MNILSEMSFAERLRQTFHACGTRDTVVRQPAMSPRTAVRSSDMATDETIAVPDLETSYGARANSTCVRIG